MPRAPHPYSLHCATCQQTTLHNVERHHSGENLPRCRHCGTFRPSPLRRARRAQMRANPSPRREIAQAARLYEDFTGHEGDEIARVELPPAPKVALAIGKVLLIGYETVRDGVREQYVHRFRRNSRPLLVASHDGKSVLLLGGAYAFTDRGIVDKGRG